MFGTPEVWSCRLPEQVLGRLTPQVCALGPEEDSVHTWSIAVRSRLCKAGPTHGGCHRGKDIIDRMNLTL